MLVVVGDDPEAERRRCAGLLVVAVAVVVVGLVVAVVAVVVAGVEKAKTGGSDGQEAMKRGKDGYSRAIRSNVRKRTI
jgi:hypothetical protein